MYNSENKQIIHHSFFHSPTDEDVNCLKNYFKIYIKFDIKTYFLKIRNTFKILKCDDRDGGRRSVGRSFKKWRNVTKSPEGEEHLTYNKMKKF